MYAPSRERAHVPLRVRIRAPPLLCSSVARLPPRCAATPAAPRLAGSRLPSHGELRQSEGGELRGYRRDPRPHVTCVMGEQWPASTVFEMFPDEDRLFHCAFITGYRRWAPFDTEPGPGFGFGWGSGSVCKWCYETPLGVKGHPLLAARGWSSL
jgi:hypothetical protein